MYDKSFCRIGIFYDGSFFNYAQRYFWHQRKLGWLDFRPFHSMIENCIRTKEQGYQNYKIVYAAWFQGMFPVSQSTEQQLRFDRNLYHDLMHAGIDPIELRTGKGTRSFSGILSIDAKRSIINPRFNKYLPTSQSGQGEKGADVALAIDALQIGLEGKMDIAVLVSGDGDLIPLVRALMKQGIRVMAAYFEYDEAGHKSSANDRLLAVCNYELNINELESDKHFKAIFKGMFRKPEDYEDVK
jgi:hypothetical protein